MNMRVLIAIAALLVGLPGAAQDHDYQMTAEIGPMGAERTASTGGDYSLVAGITALPPRPSDRVFTDSFEPSSTTRTP